MLAEREGLMCGYLIGERDLIPGIETGSFLACQARSRELRDWICEAAV